jgi:hypothetical protein
MKEFILNMLSEGSKVSSKRFIGFLGFILLSASFVVSIVSELEPSVLLTETIMYITMGALFGTSLDKIMKKGE